MKEMVGGCCVCSDERGWTENPLVYCDGQGCTVAVHQACYGIVTVPSGPWYCRKCESQENAARVRCELCPSRDGALKKTDKEKQWAHVVCALYIPEVRFGNVTTMEPIILTLIPPERFSKTCYICEEEGRGNRASFGACMQCNKSGCKQQFHVTCAQSLGLLCEEAGNYLDNVKYCGYCQHHYSKLKGGNVKTIPPYKPVHPDNVSSDSSPEKEVIDSTAKPGPVKRKNSAKSAPVSNTVAAKVSAESKDNSSTKFTTSNFVESVVTNSESVFGTETLSQAHAVIKKRKSGQRTPTLPVESETTLTVMQEPNLSRVVKTENSEPELAVIKIETHEKKIKVDPALQVTQTTTTLESVVQSTVLKRVNSPNVVAKSNVITSTGSATSSIVVSVPISAATALQQTSAHATSPTLFQQLQLSIVAANNAASNNSPPISVPVQPPHSDQPVKRRRSQSSDKPEKSRKNKRNTPTAIVSAVAPPTLPPTAIVPAPLHKRSSRSNLNTPTPPPPPPVHPQPAPMPLAMKDSPPSSPGSEAAYAGRKNKKKNVRSEPKDVKSFSNGVGAPHMLGNQLNPSSNMSKKLSDTLSAELEAHSVFTDSNTTSSLIGPQLHSRVIASVRSGAAAAAAANNANNPLSMGLGAAFAATTNSVTSNNLANVNNNLIGGNNLTGTIPQSLDQLLERQWEQGSQFLMEQAQHFDIASLLSCLHQLRAENLRLEEHVNTLLQRRDHLLAVNARLAIPLTTQPPAQVNNVHPEQQQQQPQQQQQQQQQQQPPSSGRNQRVNNTYPHGAMENGLDNVLYPSPHRSPSTGPPGHNQQGVVRNSSNSSADSRRISNQQSNYPQQNYQQANSSPSVPSQLSAATSQAIHAARRDAVTDLHAMSKHS